MEAVHTYLFYFTIYLLAVKSKISHKLCSKEGAIYSAQSKCSISIVQFPQDLTTVNPTALRTAKTLWSFGHSECNRVNFNSENFEQTVHRCIGFLVLLHCFADSLRGRSNLGKSPFLM